MPEVHLRCFDCDNGPLMSFDSEQARDSWIVAHVAATTDAPDFPKGHTRYLTVNGPMGVSEVDADG